MKPDRPKAAPFAPSPSPVSAAPYAHTHPAFPGYPSRWEPLFTESDGSPGHLEKVAQTGAPFVEALFREPALRAFAVALFRNAALWHDLGKASPEFARHLFSAGGAGDSHRSEIGGKVDHSTFGAQHAAGALPGWGDLLAYAIAGHHSGLPDGATDQAGCLTARLAKAVPVPVGVPLPVLEGVPLPEVRPPFDPFGYAFFSRMLFSCLVDADFLATENFMSPERAADRPGTGIDPAQMDRHLSQWLAGRFGPPETGVQRQREEVRKACLAAAEQSPGFFSLTVPTGGGKTFSSLAFALRHASRHGLRRVIYAIPFTSIIEQNADIFRKIFDPLSPEIVLEHHSNFDVDRETAASRLATENWDAPLVVTTNVQFFESLFANKTSRCRKLHRIAGSVIILDEAQALPVTLLEPCLRALRELVDHYGCTVLLCTATQPAIQKRDEFKIGLALSPEREIIPDAAALYDALKRVTIVDAGVLGLTALTARLAEHPRALCIVNTRRHALDLFESLKNTANAAAAGALFHLSAAMCPEHRSRALAAIRRRLLDGQPCLVVSTQLIEAGVDIDFPVVFRSIAGVDSIAQAAGRCNREGNLGSGITCVFRPDPNEHPIPRGHLKQSAEAAEEIIPLHPDILALPAVEHYFRLHYWKNEALWDKEQVMEQFHFGSNDFPFLFQFAEAATRFRFIDSADLPVIIEWDETASRLVNELKEAQRLGLFPSRRAVRKLQRYTVTLHERAWKTASARGLFEIVYDRFPVLVSSRLHYSEETGLCLPGDRAEDPEGYIL